MSSNSSETLSRSIPTSPLVPEELDHTTPSASFHEQPSVTSLDDLVVIESERPPTRSAPVKLAHLVLGVAMREYLISSAYYRGIGAQTPCTTYGGSRSLTYMQMMERSATLGELRQARRDYKSGHTASEADHDEFGGLLRILGYRMRHIPGVNAKFEAMVRKDDVKMREAIYEYPADTVQYLIPIQITKK